MKITPRDIARALIDSILDGDMNVDAACDSALALLHEKCPGTTRKNFLKILEREVKRHGGIAAGMLVVPHEHAITTEQIAPHLAEKTGKTIHLDRKVEPALIGGAVLLVDHRRLDASVQGALRHLLQMCLQPLE